ncbi:MAG: Uma2 family endonuclease [Deltaproteobacteria bacterium]|nr:Uma2 family endonuclease [Deltaproteobacteria bacterium]
MSSHSSHVHTELPAVDERLIAPEIGYEIDDGRLVHVAPSDEDHAVNQCAIGALLRAHRSVGREVAVDMLTRTTERDDSAPDASVYPSARDPETGGRQLEELAFEVLATERLGHAGTKAAKLTARGVRRVFAVDVRKQRAFEWSRELGTWEMLAMAVHIHDAALAVPLPVAALVDAVAADDATVRAYRTKRHPEFLAERMEERGDVLRRQLVLKFGPIDAEHDALLQAATPERLHRYLERVLTATNLAAVFAE